MPRSCVTARSYAGLCCNLAATIEWRRALSPLRHFVERKGSAPRHPRVTWGRHCGVPTRLEAMTWRALDHTLGVMTRRLVVGVTQSKQGSGMGLPSK